MTYFKPLLLATIVAASGFAACSGHSGAHTGEKYTAQDSVKIPNDPLPDSIILSKGTASNYVGNYGKYDSLSKIETAMKPNTRCFWISLRRLNGLVAKLNHENADGVRIYFAAYDSVYPPSYKNPPRRDYWGHNTLVMISTHATRGIHADYYNDTTFTQVKGPRGFIIDPTNRGEICPPPSNCFTQGAYLLPNK